MILLIDNYDSFTYNIFQYCAQLGAKIKVVRNDAISLGQIAKLKPSHLILSPGPGDPDSAGITLSVIKRFSGKIPILGVCLGHQAIGQAFGGKVIRAPKPKHGKISAIQHQHSGIFSKTRSPLKVARYHSLIVEKKSLPSCLRITAETSDGLIMALEHKSMPVFGVQFHPESIATEEGLLLFKNFLRVGHIKKKGSENA